LCQSQEVAVLYRCETWSVTLREEPRLRILENRAPRKIHGSRREEVTEELHDADYSPGEFNVIHTVHLLTFNILNQQNVPIEIQQNTNQKIHFI